MNLNLCCVEGNVMLNKTKYIVTMLAAISVGGIAYTQSKEGTVLVPYKDSAGVATIGTGTTVYPNSQKVKITGLDPVTIIGLVIGLSGLLVSILSFLINWHYKQKEDQRAQELHEFELMLRKGKCNVKQD